MGTFPQAQTLCIPGTTICTKISLMFVNKPAVAVPAVPAAAEPETTTTELPTTTTEVSPSGPRS